MPITAKKFFKFVVAEAELPLKIFFWSFWASLVAFFIGLLWLGLLKFNFNPGAWEKAAAQILVAGGIILALISAAGVAGGILRAGAIQEEPKKKEKEADE